MSRLPRLAPLADGARIETYVVDGGYEFVHYNADGEVTATVRQTEQQATSVMEALCRSFA